MFSPKTSLLIKAVQQAEAVVMKHFDRIVSESHQQTKMKEAGDIRSIVTEADALSEKAMAECVLEDLQGISVLGEETGFVAGDNTRLVMDGIDGTLGFSCGIGASFGIMAALETKGKVTSAVVSIPSLREMIIAEHGRGCWVARGKSFEPKHGAPIVNVSQAIVGIWRSNAPNRGEVLNREPFPSIQRQCLTTFNLLSSAVTVHRLVLGAVHAIVVPWHYYWDFVCARLILKELGGDFDVYPVDRWIMRLDDESLFKREGNKDNYNFVGAVNTALFQNLQQLIWSSVGQMERS